MIKEKFILPDGKEITVFKAYHIEGGRVETVSKFHGISDLSIESLKDDKPLFLCDNPFEWLPDHLESTNEFKVYEIKINSENLTIKDYSVWDDYVKLTSWDEALGKIIVTDELLLQCEQGIELHRLIKNNDKKELSEMFLINARKHIVSIRLLKQSMFGLPLTCYYCDTIVDDNQSKNESLENLIEVGKDVLDITGRLILNKMKIH